MALKGMGSMMRIATVCCAEWMRVLLDFHCCVTVMVLCGEGVVQVRCCGERETLLAARVRL
jgi:hypothetical protein